MSTLIVGKERYGYLGQKHLIFLLAVTTLLHMEVLKPHRINGCLSPYEAYLNEDERPQPCVPTR